MKSTLALIPALLIGLAAGPAPAAEALVRCRITGLFQPDRVDDLRRQGGALRLVQGDASAELRLVEVDYDDAEATYAYDPDTRPLKNSGPGQVRERIDHLLRDASRGAFSALPPSTLPADRRQEIRIGVAGLDCKGCAFGAYRALAKLDGVERATVDFRRGIVTARVDPAKTNRDALVAALKKAEVDVLSSLPDQPDR
jgi:copper chaperone CopZ